MTSSIFHPGSFFFAVFIFVEAGQSGLFSLDRPQINGTVQWLRHQCAVLKASRIGYGFWGYIMAKFESTWWQVKKLEVIVITCSPTPNVYCDIISGHAYKQHNKHDKQIERNLDVMQLPGVEPRTPLGWAASALPLSHDNWKPPTLTIFYIYCTGGTEVPQSHTWQPLSMCHQNSIRGWPENCLQQERTHAARALGRMTSSVTDMRLTSCFSHIKWGQTERCC